MTTTTPIAIPEDQIPAMLGLGELTSAMRARLRKLGQLPPVIEIGNAKVVLVVDLEAFIATRRDATAAKAARRSENNRKNVSVRWAKARAA